jgi:hypothetical protein
MTIDPRFVAQNTLGLTHTPAVAYNTMTIDPRFVAQNALGLTHMPAVNTVGYNTIDPRFVTQSALGLTHTPFVSAQTMPMNLNVGLAPNGLSHTGVNNALVGQMIAPWQTVSAINQVGAPMWTGLTHTPFVGYAVPGMLPATLNW